LEKRRRIYMQNGGAIPQIHYLCRESLLLGSELNKKIKRGGEEIQLQDQGVVLICGVRRLKKKLLEGYLNLSVLTGN
jgi:hypothetical protein